MSDLQRIGELSRETLREWWIRFAKKRNMPPMTDDEITELIRLGDEDARQGHQ